MCLETGLCGILKSHFVVSSKILAIVNKTENGILDVVFRKDKIEEADDQNAYVHNSVFPSESPVNSVYFPLIIEDDQPKSTTVELNEWENMYISMKRDYEELRIKYELLLREKEKLEKSAVVDVEDIWGETEGTNLHFDGSYQSKELHSNYISSGALRKKSDYNKDNFSELSNIPQELDWTDDKIDSYNREVDAFDEEELDISSESDGAITLNAPNIARDEFLSPLLSKATHPHDYDLKCVVHAIRMVLEDNKKKTFGFESSFTPKIKNRPAIDNDSDDITDFNVSRYILV